MYKIILFLLLGVAVVVAKNPQPYRALGDILYDNSYKVKNLQNFQSFAPYKSKIEHYLIKLKAAKQEGFALQNGDIEKKEKYLKDLRTLAKEYDAIKREVQKLYEKAILTKDVKLFTMTINSGLLDAKRYKKEIIAFYFENMSSMKPTGLIKRYLDEDAKLRKLRERRKRKEQIKKERELQKIKRIRKNDLQEQKRIEEELQKELLKKKEEIREYQKRELSKTI